MRINERTKYKEFQKVEKYLTKQSVQRIKDAAEKKYGGMYDMPFERFYSCANGDFSHLYINNEPTVLQVYWQKRFEEFVKEFAQALQKLTLPATDDERVASQDLLKLEWGEAILVFVQNYFGCRSFKEAEQITIGEILIAKRAQYNKDKYMRQLGQVQARKMQHKK